jgi:hypothetical protein
MVHRRRFKSRRRSADADAVGAELRQLVDRNLSWARDEVVLLVGTLALPGEDQLGRLLDQLARLTADTNDPGRRLALLLQLGVAMTGLFETVERQGRLDRLELGDLLYTLLRSDLPDAGGEAPEPGADPVGPRPS